MPISKSALKTDIHSFLDGLGNQIAASALKGVPLVGDLDVPIGQTVFAPLLPLIDQAIDAAGSATADLVAALNGIPGITATMDGSDIAIRLQAVQTLSLLDEAFNAGASAAGIGLGLDGNFATALTAALDVGLKVDGTTGNLSIVDPGNTKELSLRLTSDLKVAGNGDLGFLSIEVKDKATIPEIDLAATIDLKAGDVKNAFLAPLLPTYTGSAGLDLGIKTKVAGGKLPSIGADLVMGYDFVSKKQTIAFEHISLDMGTLLGSFGGVFAELAKLRDTFPLGIILDIATGELPLIDSLSDKTGLDGVLDRVPSIQKDGKITLADLAVLYDDVSGSGIGKYFDGLATLALVLGYAKALGAKTLDLDLGAFTVAGDPAKSVDSFSGLLPAEAKSTFDDLVDQLTGSSGTGRASGGGLSSKDGLSIPILDDPSLIVKLLLNQVFKDPVTIVQYDMPDLHYDVGKSLTLDFPILGPLGLTLEGDAAVAIDIGVGYDSKALETGKFEDGLFFTNFNDAGQPTNEPIVHLQAGIHAGVVLNAVVLRASVTGGITFDINGSLRDLIPDSKTRLSEVGSFPIVPSGKAAADVRVRLRIGFGPFSYSKTIPLVSVVLVDFSLSGNGQGPSSPPNQGLATLIGTDLRLNTGNFASTRVLNNIKGDDSKEFEAYQIGFATDMQGAVIPGALAISGFGTTQVFGAPGAGPLRIVGDLGELDDSLIVSAGVTQAIQVSGGRGDDMIVGGKGADTINGGVGSDYLVGNDGDDVINGGDEDDAKGEGDTLVGGAGADQLNGGRGFDTVSYAEAKQTVGVKLLKVPGIVAIVGFGGEAEGDLLTGIDQLTGTDYADTLTADDDTPGAARAPRTLEGLGGDDALIGGAGDDLLVGGTGGDFLQGGGGRNGTSYLTSYGGVVIDLGAKVYYGGDATGDWLENIQEVYGSGAADTLTGGAANETLDGFFGNDRLSGGGGADILVGGLGDDTVFGGLDGDTLNGDTKDGDPSDGAGVDLLSYRNYQGILSVDLGAGTASNSNPFRPRRDTITKAKRYDAATDSFVEISDKSSFENLEGADMLTQGDGLTGDAYDNAIWGLGGNDRINGGGGFDRLIGGLGADQMDGGEGIDWAEYRDSTAGVTVRLDGTAGAAFDGSASGVATSIGDVLTNVENLLGSDQSDNLYGDAGDNVIDPGLTGTERYYDFVDGGSGRDVLRLDYSRGDYGQGFSGGYFSGSSTGGYGERRDKSGNIVLDAISFANIEALWFTGTRLADTMIGGSGNDVLVGGSGGDTIYAGTGNDIVDAGSGADAVFYGTGTDRNLAGGVGLANFRIDGGSGIDTLSLSLSGVSEDIVIAGPVTPFNGTNLVLSNGATISNFEILRDVWTGSGNDTVTQLGRFDNNIRTGDGNDVIRPGLGFDAVDGGINTTGLVYDPADGRYRYADVEAFNRAAGDRLVLDYSSVSNAALVSSSSAQAGDSSQPPAGFGIYVPNGSYYHRPLTNSGFYQTVASDGTVTNQAIFSEIESVDVTGTQGGDTLVGTGTESEPGRYHSRGGDVLRGAGGNDTIFGLSGSDDLYGDAGNDTLQGTSPTGELRNYESNLYDHDTLTGGSGADTFVFGTARGTLYGEVLVDVPNNQVLDFNYGEAMDFNAAAGDKIVLYGDASMYVVRPEPGLGFVDIVKPSSIRINLGSNEFPNFRTYNYFDLIARVNGTTSFDLNSPAVTYVGGASARTLMATGQDAPAAAVAPQATGAPAVVATALAPVVAAATTWVTQDADPAALLAKLGLGSGVVAGSQSLTIEGSGEGFGTFDNDPFGLGSGVVLSTGNVEELGKPNTLDRPAGPATSSIKLDFVKIGRAGNSDIYRADLSGLGIDIASLRLADGNTRTGGSGGIASGFDIDSFVFSATKLDSVGSTTNLNDASVLPRLDVIGYDQASLFFTPGSQRPPNSGLGYGPDLDGSINGYPGSAAALIKNPAVMLSSFSAAGQSNSLTLGDGGSLGANLKAPLNTDGPVYLYIGEEGGTGEAIIGDVTVSSDKIQPAGDLSTDLGAPGLDGDTSRMTYSFTPIAGTDLVTFQVVLFSEELPEHAGILDPDAVTVTLNGVSIASLSDGAAADFNTMMPSATRPTHKDLILNPPGSGPLASTVAADAYTKTLTFVGRVQAGVTNTLVIEAADKRDAYLDTGILIKGGTFLSAGGTLATNAAPIAVADVAAVAANTPYSGNVLTNDIDPNGDPLTAVLASGPKSGTVTLGTNGSFTYTPKAGFFGNDSFTYRANDGKTSGAPGTVMLVVGRPAGVSADADGPYAAAEDTALSVDASAGVLAGDITTTGKPLSATLVTTTRNGTLNLKADGSFTYRPKANFSGTDSFVYRAGDGTLNSAAVTVVIETAAQNDAPVLAVGTSGAKLVEAGVLPNNAPAGGTQTASIQLSKSDVDAGDTTSFDTTGWLAAGAGKVSKSGLYGTAVLTTATGAIAYTLDNTRDATNALAAGAAVLDGFDITIRDAAGATMTGRANFTVIGANDAPLLGAGLQSLALVEAGTAPNGVGLIGTSVATIALTASDPDAGDVATFQSAGWTPAGVGLLSRTGTYGSIVLNTATGVMTYTLDNARPATMALLSGATVTDAFAVTVKDKAGASATRSVGFTIQGTNDRPMLIVGSPSRPVVEAGTGIPGTPTATIALTKSGGSGAMTFVTTGWTSLGGTRYSRGGTYGSAILDTASGLLAYTLDNQRAVTDDLETGDLRSDGFSITLKDSTGATVIRTASFNIVGSGDGVTINGSAGRDRISADSSAPGQPRPTKHADAIFGNDGDDIIAGLGGKDTIDGGAGADTADYTEKTAPVAVRLNGATNAIVSVGGVSEDTIRNIENLVGGSGNDTFTGDGLANTLSGRGGKDTLDGGAGFDTADYFEKTASVAVTLNSGTNVTVTVGGVAEDTLRNIENLVGGSAGDTFTGDAFANTFAGRGGKDVLDGRAGSDTADYSEKTAAVAVTLNGATSATVTVGGVAEDTVRNIENIVGGSASDVLTGDANANGLFGRDGNDVLKGAAGKDVLDGGNGTDTADYAEKTSAVAVTLNGATNATVSIGGVAEDTIRNIENLIGGSIGDTLIGDASANVLSGRGGKDVLDGGAGIDTANYAEKTSAVVVTLNGAANATVSIGGTVEDTVRNIENLIGGSAGDTLIGDALANVLSGRGGRDALDGGAGIDTVDYAEKTAAVTVTLNGATNATVSVGGVAEDTVRNIENLIGGSAGDLFIGDAFANIFFGRGGKDVLDGGAGSDTADYSEKTATVAVTLNGATSASVTVGGTAEDTVRNIENLVGGSANDALTGDASANSLFGRDGNDILKGGSGKDVLDGGRGADTADYSEKTSAVKVTLNGATDATATVGGIAEDTLRNIENLVGGSGNDTFIGDAFGNTFAGRGGKDILDGGAGMDTADYSDKTASVSVTLNGASDATVSVGGLAEDTIRNIENLVGGSASDRLTGDASANALFGRDGNDILKGGIGKDVLDGGNGLDTADYSDKLSSVVVSLNGSFAVAVAVGGIAEDTIVNVENVIGGAAGDTLTGDGLANLLTGNAGDDTLDGGLGNDILQGGLGADRFVFSTSLNAATNIDRISDFNVADDTILLSRAIFGALGAGDLQAADFAVGTGATTAAQNIVYDKSSGRLFYDADGTGAAAQVQFASIAPNLTLTAADFKAV